jgi:hypothetical protein
MKIRIIVLAGILWGFAASVGAQVPNPGFENWTAGNPDGWFVSNVQGAFTTTTQTSDAHSGSSAAHGEVVSYFTTFQAPIFQSGTDAMGFPVSQAFSSVDLFYKFSPQGGDRFAVNVAVQSNGNAIGAGAVALPATVGNYTALSVPINYTSADIPDTAIIQISIVGPNGADYHLGSVMWVDDITLSGATGMVTPAEAAKDRMVFPNPAQKMVQVNFPCTQSGTLDVLDGRGKTVQAIPFSSDGKTVTVQIPVVDLPSGIYFYRIHNSTSPVKGKFSVFH